MRFLMIYHTDHATAEGPPSQDVVTKMGKFIEESTKAGILLSTGGTCGVSYGTRVRNREGEITVTDGPFAEAKELVGGYALMELPSKAAAVEHAQQFLRIIGTGETEIHQLAG